MEKELSGDQLNFLYRPWCCKANVNRGLAENFELPLVSRASVKANSCGLMVGSMSSISRVLNGWVSCFRHPVRELIYVGNS
jgi:hypothetical protein